jgi:hypothetical protein
VHSSAFDRELCAPNARAGRGFGTLAQLPPDPHPIPTRLQPRQAAQPYGASPPVVYDDRAAPSTATPPATASTAATSARIFTQLYGASPTTRPVCPWISTGYTRPPNR